MIISRVDAVDVGEWTMGTLISNQSGQFKEIMLSPCIPSANLVSVAGNRRALALPRGDQRGRPHTVCNNSVTMKSSCVLGIDVGGSGIKAGLVDCQTHQLVTERLRRETPNDGKPKPILAAIASLAEELNWRGPVGVGFPGVIQAGVIKTAANLDASWLGRVLADDLSALGLTDVTVLNDADAAGYGELQAIPEAEQTGSHLFLTIGTGVGSAWLANGELIANTEFGHLLVRPSQRKKTIEIETYLSKVTRKSQKISWEGWAARCNEALAALHQWLWPDRFILGGGAAKRWEKFGEHLRAPVPVRPARLGNDAGVIGAAAFAAHHSKQLRPADFPA